MTLGPKTSLGIDISEHRISIALIKQTKSGIKLLKSADAEIPEGAITDGNVTDPVLLAGTIRKILKQNRIKIRQAVVSLIAKPVLNQIVELPEDIPGNMSQFVRGEIKHSPVLAGKEPQCDYCRLGSSGQEDLDRIFVGATDVDKVLGILKTFSAAGIDATMIELPVMSAVRAVYSEKICNRYDCNVLVVLLHGSVITLCVYRKDEMDFVRSVDMADQMSDPDKYLERCDSEINAVIQYYDVEIESAEDKWEILAVLENPQISSGDLEVTLQKSFGLGASVCSPETIYANSSLLKNDSIDKCSVTAVGLAMRNLSTNENDFAIDLIPPEAEEMKANKKFALMTANLAAVVLLVVFLIGGIVRVQLGRTQAQMERRKEDSPKDSIEQLLAQQRRVNSQIAYLTDKKTRMSDIFEGDKIYDWPGILDDVRKKVPETLYITNLSAQQGSDFMIEGNARSFKSIHVFADLLGGSEHIKSAVVAQTAKSSRIDGLVAYSIACVLSDNEGL